MSETITHMNLSQLTEPAEVREWHYSGDYAGTPQLLRQAANWLKETDATLIAAAYARDNDGEHFLIVTTPN